MKKQTKIVISALLGNGLEFYDFTLFSAFTVQLSQLFFAADEDPTSKMLKTLLLFGVGFFARPVGALFFGHIGDRLGRKYALGMSIALMGIGTFCIGCLPTYAYWGVWASGLLCFLRLFQGFCLGGENNGSAIFFLEHLKKHKGLAGALIITGGAVGTLLANGFSVLTTLGMPDYAWRFPFLIGLGIGFLGLYIRRRLPETADFLKIKSTQVDRLPLSQVWRYYRRPFLCAIGIGGVNVALVYTATVYLNVYMTSVLHVPLKNSLLMTCLAIVLFGGIFAPLMGYLADRFSPSRVMSFACVAVMLLAFPLFYAIHSGTNVGFFIGIIIAAFLAASFNGPTNAYLNTLFPAHVRYTAIAFGYSLGAACLGGLAPYYYTWLIKLSGNPFAPAFYMIFIAAIGGLSLHFSAKDVSISSEKPHLA